MEILGKVFPFRDSQRDILHIEDHADFRVSPEQIVSLWRVISDEIDIRTNVFETLNKKGQIIDINVVKKYLDSFSPSFSYYMKQIEILKMYEKMKQRKTHYFNGVKRANWWIRCYVRIINRLYILINRLK